jgi:hypothetical protein
MDKEVFMAGKNEEILSIQSPRERLSGYCIRGPWFVLQTNPVDDGFEAYVLLDWQGEPDEPFVPRIGRRLFKKDGPGTPISHGYPIWQIEEPSAINALSLDPRIKTIAEDFLSGGKENIPGECLHTIAILQDTLEMANLGKDRALTFCWCLYQKMGRQTRGQNEKEAHEIDEELKRIKSESKGRPEGQTLRNFIEGRGFLPNK